MKCKKHPKYIKPTRPPTSNCETCKKIWEDKLDWEAYQKRREDELVCYIKDMIVP